ncbi:MAG: hypothetical protein AAF206_31325 [Bacteroidota bacterium]
MTNKKQLTEIRIGHQLNEDGSYQIRIYTKTDLTEREQKRLVAMILGQACAANAQSESIIFCRELTELSRREIDPKMMNRNYKVGLSINLKEWISRFLS